MISGGIEANYSNLLNGPRVWINFSIVIREKNGVLNTAGVWGSCDSPFAACPGQSHAGDQENLIFIVQKAVHWLIIYSFFT